MLVLGYISPRPAIFGTVSGLIKMMGFMMFMNTQVFMRVVSISFCQILFFCSLTPPPITTLWHVKFNFTSGAREKRCIYGWFFISIHNYDRLQKNHTFGERGKRKTGAGKRRFYCCSGKQRIYLMYCGPRKYPFLNFSRTTVS